MTATDLILRGTVTLGGTDVSAEVTGLTIKGMINDIVVPPTLTLPKGHIPGARKYTAQIDYLSDDSVSTNLFRKLWTAVGTDSKELAFTARLRSGAIGVGNPQWNGTIIVAGADLGGDVETLSQGSITCTMTGAPNVTTS